MTLRWNTSIAALAFLALAATLISADAPWAAEPEVQKLAAGPGDSPSPGDADTTPGEDSDAAPAASPGDDQAPEGAEPGKDAGAPPAEETAEPKEPAPDAKPEEKAEEPEGKPEEQAEEPEGKPEEQAAPAKDDEAEGKEEDQAAPAKDDDEGKEAEAPAELKEADAESAAAVEKVKAGDIPVPTDPVALAAFQALEANCARCHQAGASLKRKKPPKDFGNILHLEEIAQVPGLILPGNPDGSKLFIQIAKQEMPYDCFQEFNCEREPTEKEVQAIYDWIKSLGAGRGRRLHGSQSDRRGSHRHRYRRRSRRAAGASAQGHALHHADQFLQRLRAGDRHGALPPGRGEAAQQPEPRVPTPLKMRTIDPDKTDHRLQS